MCNVTNEILNALEFLSPNNKRKKIMFLNTLVRHDKVNNIEIHVKIYIGIDWNSLSSCELF